MKTSDNGIVLAREINWLAIIIDHRMRAYFGDEQDSFRIDDIPPPELQVDMPGYTQIVRCLSVAERLVLALAIAPHLQPELLDTFLTRNDMTGQPFTEFGGVTTGYHKGVIPTGQTAIFLLAGNDIYNRMNALQQLRTSVLFRKILSLGKVNLYEPVLNGPLVISDEHLYEMISMAANPAAQVQLARQIDTDLEWDDMVLDETTLSKVNEVNMWIKHASTLVGDSELRKKLRPGYRCLFYGAEGTGKRTVACLIGKTAGKDVYRVDLAT
ncbi:MAG: ATP-binding protein, partial [Chitinophagaceae bacterium]|nr:ATP-binding protein [Chitinophagaceae bacterium]